MTEQENTQQENTTESTVHHQTKRGADMSLARKEISPDSHRAVHEGRISLEEARELGREGSPYGPAKKTVAKNDRTPTPTPCLCGCGDLVPRSFKAGHDMVMFRVAREHLTEGRELTKEQAGYLETSGKMARVKTRLAEEEAKLQEKIEAKAQKQREREGKAEKAKADEKS